MGPRRIAIVAYPDVQLLDVVGPLEVFSLADRFARERGAASPYDVTVVATAAGPLVGSSGLAIVPGARLRASDRAPDTVVVAGGVGTPAAARDAELLGALRRWAPRCRRTTAVCSGAFVLAAAGLLDGRRATTHWSECDRLAAWFPAVTVERDPIYVRDGSVATSAGITAGMDLALALVEEDLGRAAALEVARWMVLFVHRPGGQSQFSAQLAVAPAADAALRELQSWIVEHPDSDLRVAALARRVAMSPRHFARVFRREVGTTPAAYVEQVRVEVARRLLEQTGLGLDSVAAAAGLGTAETLRRSFHRVLGVAPSDYRARFRVAS